MGRGGWGGGKGGYWEIMRLSGWGGGTKAVERFRWWGGLWGGALKRGVNEKGLEGRERARLGDYETVRLSVCGWARGVAISDLGFEMGRGSLRRSGLHGIQNIHQRPLADGEHALLWAVQVCNQQHD